MWGWKNGPKLGLSRGGEVGGGRWVGGRKG